MDLSPVGDRAEAGTAAGEAELVQVLWDVLGCGHSRKMLRKKTGSFHAGFILHQLKAPTGSLWILRDRKENSPGKCQIPPKGHFLPAVKESWKGLKNGKSAQSPEKQAFYLSQ